MKTEPAVNILELFDSAQSEEDAKRKAAKAEADYKLERETAAFKPLANALMQLLKKREIFVAGDYGRPVPMMLFPEGVRYSREFEGKALVKLQATCGEIDLGLTISRQVLKIRSDGSTENMRFGIYIERYYPYNSDKTEYLPHWIMVYEKIVKILSERKPKPDWNK